MNCRADPQARRGFLAGIGCGVLPGFLFARPLPAAQFEHWLAQGGASS